MASGVAVAMFRKGATIIVGDGWLDEFYEKKKVSSLIEGRDRAKKHIASPVKRSYYIDAFMNSCLRCDATPHNVTRKKINLELKI